MLEFAHLTSWLLSMVVFGCWFKLFLFIYENYRSNVPVISGYITWQIETSTLLGLFYCHKHIDERFNKRQEEIIEENVFYTNIFCLYFFSLSRTVYKFWFNTLIQENVSTKEEKKNRSSININRWGCRWSMGESPHYKIRKLCILEPPDSSARLSSCFSFINSNG